MTLIERLLKWLEDALREDPESARKRKTKKREHDLFNPSGPFPPGLFEDPDDRKCRGPWGPF